MPKCEVILARALKDARVFLIAGLGNPGARYQKTRHNVGFMLVDRLAESAGRRFRQSLKHSLICATRRRLETVILAKPLTFMNLSGQAVRELLIHYPVDPGRLLIVYDEVALPLGKIRIRLAGSAGGHKGMESIIGSLGRRDLPRLRIGVSQENPPPDLTDFVLSPFDRDEQALLEQSLVRAQQALDTILVEGFDRAMALYN
ncbi:MAG: aminoacyl-tRNA hydrolase [Acidobacteriota bacterium]